MKGAVGNVGGHTTFSHDTLRLLEAGSFIPALLTAAGQLVAGLAAVYTRMPLYRGL